MPLRPIAIAALLLATPAFAQDHAGHGATADVPALPPICVPDQSMATDMPMAMDHEMDQAHTDLMAGMAETNRQMMDAMMIENIDIAFVCGMIPHHQAAIAMARAELEHGQDPWARDMAQKIIDAQEAEIADMLAWLETQDAGE